MPDDVQFTPLEPGEVGDAQLADLDRLTAVSVELTVEIGRTRMTLGEALALGPGSVVTLDRMADQPVDLLVNGKRIARGEVVVVDEEFGLRVTEVAPAPGARPAVAERPALPGGAERPALPEAA
jgi:flagellar motor switch protein FliN/FliY